MIKHSKKYVAEFLGTFALVLVGAGAVVVEGHTGASHGLADTGKLGIVGIALAHGLTLTAMIYGLGSISGGHFNPAVTIAAWVRKRLGADLIVGYLLAQVLGALVAAILLATIFPDEVGLAQLGTPALGPRISGLQGFAIEGAITFLLTLVVLTSTRADNSAAHPFAGLAIGATLIGLILFAGPLTGASANPARYLGPAIVSRNLESIWLYAAFAIGLAVETAQAPAAVGSASTKELRSGASKARGRRRRAAELAEGVEEPELLEEVVDDEKLAAETSARSSRNDRTQQILTKAQELYWGGNGEKAAATLVPLLARASRDGRAISEHVRSLLLVIEDTHGRIAVLDSYRQFLDRPETSQAP
jgi:aquaporin Z